MSVMGMFDRFRRKGRTSAPARDATRTGSTRVRASDGEDVRHLENFVRTRQGVEGFVEPRTVDVHVARLRGKFISAELPAPGIETVRGVGYRFREAKPGRP